MVGCWQWNIGLVAGRTICQLPFAHIFSKGCSEVWSALTCNVDVGPMKGQGGRIEVHVHATGHILRRWHDYHRLVQV